MDRICTDDTHSKLITEIKPPLQFVKNFEFFLLVVSFCRRSVSSANGEVLCSGVL